MSIDAFVLVYGELDIFVYMAIGSNTMTIKGYAIRNKYHYSSMILVVNIVVS